MNNNINKNTVNQMTPEYPINPLPGQALQGSILFTTTDFTKPPVSNANLIWMAMEDIIGTADIKVDYDVDTSTYHLYKAKGHLDNQEVWHYTWDEVANWVALTEDVQEALLMMRYIAYDFQDLGNRMVVNGIDKEGVSHQLIDVSFADQAYVDAAVATLNTRIDNEVERATNRENELEEMIKKARPLSGVATDTTADGTNGTKINVRYNKGLEVNNNNQLDVKIDEDTIKEDSNGDLYADNVRDNINTSNKYTWSIDKIKSMLASNMIYMGSVQTYNDLPTDYTTDDKGKVWNIIQTGVNYAWTGTEWDELGGQMLTEGRGIKIEDGVIETRIDGSKGLGFDSQHRMYTNIDTNKGLQFQPNGKLEVKVDETKGVDIDSYDGKIKAKIDTDKGLQFDSVNGNIQLKVANGLQFDNAGRLEATGIEFSAGDGLEVVDVGTPEAPEKKINIRANFTLDPTPLGDKESNLTIYSDNKIGIKADVAVIPILGMNASQIASKVPSSLNWNLSGREQCIVFSLVKGDFTVLNEIPASDINKYTYIAVCTRSLNPEPALLTINKNAGIVGEYTFGLNGMDTFIRPLPYPANSSYGFNTAMAGIAGVREVGISDGTTPLVQGILTYHQLSSSTPGNQSLDINNVKASVPSNITIYAFPKGNQ